MSFVYIVVQIWKISQNDTCGCTNITMETKPAVTVDLLHGFTETQTEHTIASNLIHCTFHAHTHRSFHLIKHDITPSSRWKVSCRWHETCACSVVGCVTYTPIHTTDLNATYFRGRLSKQQQQNARPDDDEGSRKRSFSKTSSAPIWHESWRVGHLKSDCPVKLK